MIAFFANLFGYLLNFLYNLLNNFGFAIILFSILVKIILLPISISQQKTMKKTAKIQDELKVLQVKYKNNPEALQKETMEVYKREKMNPFSGCLSAIIQIVLLFSVFYLVRSPLTHMKKIDTQIITDYTTQMNENAETRDAYPEISIIREKSAEDERVYINMEFLGLDLSKIPSKDFSDWKTYIIPVLYVITTFASMKITTSMQAGNKKGVITEEEKKVEEDEDEEEKEEETPSDVMAQTSKNMTYMMPILSISISMFAPLGLALYWLTNNILMIAERLILNKVIKDEEEKDNA